jgi:hypothetical protein
METGAITAIRITTDAIRFIEMGCISILVTAASITSTEELYRSDFTG